MEEIKELLVRDVVISNKTLRQADNILKNILEKDASQAIKDLSSLFCDQDAKLFPNNFLQHAVTQVAGKQLADQYANLCKEKLKLSFWEAIPPNVCSLINFWTMYGNKITFEGKEVSFVLTICRNILKFPQHSFKTLPKVIEGFVAFVNETNFSFGIELQSLENDFESTHLLSYFTTAFLNVANHEMNYESLGAIRFIASSMMHLHSQETLKGVFSVNHLSQHLLSKMTQQRFILLLAELAREMKSSEDALGVFDRAYNLSKTSTDPDVLTNCYNAVTLAITTIDNMKDKLQECSDLMLRDFSTANDQVRLSLCRMFDAIIKRAEKEDSTVDVCHFFIDEFLDIPWNSKLKKYTMPTLLQYVHPDKSVQLLETLLKASEDQNNKPFIAKCIASFTGLKYICLSFIDVMINDAINTSQTAALIPLNALLFPLLRANKDLIHIMYEKITKVTQKFAKAWLKFELVIAAPSVTKEVNFISEIREDLKYARKNGNWDLRCRSMHAFAYAGFPYTEEDCDDFVNDMEGIMLIDSTIHQTAICDSMNELFKRISTQGKKFSNLNTQKFLENLLKVVTKHMGSCYIPTQRSFSFTIANNLWKYFPQIHSNEDLILLASLLNDRAFDIRQQVISTMRELAKQDNVKDLFVNLKSEDVEKFVLRLEQKVTVKIEEKDFPPMEYDQLVKIKLLLARNDTTVDNCEFYKEKIFDILYSEKFDENHWETQSEFFSVLSYICLKLKSDISPEKIENATKKVFLSLFNTRIPGFVCQSVETLERFLKICYYIGKSNVADEFTVKLIEALNSYDMANMRRSAGLPFLALALIRSEPANSPLNLFVRLITALIKLIRETENDTEAANAMNILKAIVNESESSAKCEPLFGEILAVIFDAAYRFKSWDVISAVDLTLVAFLHKTCNIGGIDAAASTSIIRYQFFSKIQNSRETLLTALNSFNSHAIYMANAILELFKADTGDKELSEAIIQHLQSRLSRIRRVASRALLAVYPITERRKLFDILSERMCGHGWNTFHGCVLAMRLISEIEDVKGCYVPYMNVNVIPPMAREDYLICANAAKVNIQPLKLVQGHFISDEASALAYCGIFSDTMTSRTIVPLLRNWSENKEVPKEMFDFLLSKIISDDVLDMNEAVSINASQFLSKRLPNNYISNEKLPKLIDLVMRAHSVALRSSLISLLTKMENPDIKEIEKCRDLFISESIDFSSKMTPVHLSLASITNLLLKSEKLIPVVFLLVMNDIPAVRTKVLSSYALMNNDDMKCEMFVMDELLKKISNETKHEIAKLWIKNLENQLEVDEWGEPTSLFVDELFIPRYCVPEINKATKNINPLLPILEMRKEFVNIAKNLA
ncbi:hypothetical protein TVAG_473130 [Trichomonas vaginalis G3]|uniref:DUF2428 domain-containing protein n=1 Tax=Trichomonas vaginalis (strain ATCC PRA-98 / G3) TaxID=412133 RepID=A2ERV9_TRIV3|nr:thyroid adenoma-associated protein-like protein family [Trichomonas vaginalis G3]EAY04626.1 hypothetical protein TVAG_473130 [Trichomonas vaginalis G3]KAI5539611.1 thyroid adenoma-associated protein-like protein family [Trichomonas vaginalis G3]|eukprot:XP_001316849.1 hypothetical protein [Trichomonas vaginalis G3]